VRAFFGQAKPVAAICHGPWMVSRRAPPVTRWPPGRPAADIENAGGHWVDEPVQVDGNLVTSRKPDDLDQFCAAMVDQYLNVRASA
jgi:protease I